MLVRDKMLHYLIVFIFILSLPNSLLGKDAEETTTLASIEATTETAIDSSTTESAEGSTTEAILGSTTESALDLSTTSPEESTTIETATSTESSEDATSTMEPSSEPEPSAEPELDTKSEPPSKPEPKHAPPANISSKLEPIKKQLNETKESEKTADKCSCPVSNVLVSMVDVLKDLNSEVQSLKSQMILKCPGFGDGNETDDASAVPDSLETSNTTDAATELEEASEGPTTTPLPPIPTECDAPFQPVASSCYYFLYYPQDWKSWGEANAYCQTLGGTLAAPHRFGDLRDYLVNNFSNVFWIGAKKAIKGDTYEWITGKTFQKEDWKEGEPSKAAARFCLYVESFSGYKAINYYCGEKFSFICEKRGAEE